MAVQQADTAKSLRGNSAMITEQLHTMLSTARRATSHHLQANTGEPRTSEDLRQTALRNELTRVNSTSKVEPAAGSGRGSHMAPKNKNIPMVAAPVIGRLGETRWGTYSLNQPALSPIGSSATAGLPEQKLAQKASISPLTQMHRHTVRSRSRNLPGSIEAYDPSHGDPRTSGGSSECSSRSTLREHHLHERSVGRFPDKRSNHNSMFSLAPMGRSDSEPELSEDERTRASDAEKPEDLEEVYEENYEEAYLQIPGLANATSVLDLMKDESPSGDKPTAREAAGAGLNASRPVTRTHQKVLDMKMLRYRQEAAGAANTATLAGGPMGNLPEYAVRIQHEAVVSQWTQIRLRFSSRPEATGGGRTNVTCRAGVLGSIKRNEAQFAAIPIGRRLLGPALTRENVHAYLCEMWNDVGPDAYPREM